MAGHQHALLARVVVHEADHRAGQLRVAAQLQRHLLAAVAGADDQHLGVGALDQRLAQRPLDHGAHQEARAADQGQREQEVQRHHAARRVGDADGQQEQADDEHEARHHDGLDDRLEVRLVDEPPQLGVEAERGEQRHLQHDHEPDRDRQQLLVALGDARVEAQHEGQVVGQRDQAGVDPHLSEAACGDRRCDPCCSLFSRG